MIHCLDCGKEVPDGPRCHTCAAEHRWKVSEADAQMLALHRDEGLTYSQIAERSGVSKSRVAQRVHRARAREAAMA